MRKLRKARRVMRSSPFPSPPLFSFLSPSSPRAWDTEEGRDRLPLAPSSFTSTVVCVKGTANLMMSAGFFPPPPFFPPPFLARSGCTRSGDSRPRHPFASPLPSSRCWPNPSAAGPGGEGHRGFPIRRLSSSLPSSFSLFFPSSPDRRVDARRQDIVRLDNGFFR